MILFQVNTRFPKTQLPIVREGIMWDEATSRRGRHGGAGAPASMPGSEAAAQLLLTWQDGSRDVCASGHLTICWISLRGSQSGSLMELRIKSLSNTAGKLLVCFCLSYTHTKGRVGFLVFFGFCFFGTSVPLFLTRCCNCN